MITLKTTEVRMSRGEKGFRFECPADLDDEQMERFARDRYKSLMGKRAYGFKYERL